METDKIIKESNERREKLMFHIATHHAEKFYKKGGDIMNIKHVKILQCTECCGETFNVNSLIAGEKESDCIIIFCEICGLVLQQIKCKKECKETD